MSDPGSPFDRPPSSAPPGPGGYEPLPPWAQGPPGPPPPHPPFRTVGTNGTATAAMVCGIAGFMVCPLVGIIAIALGVNARREIRRTGQDGDGQALAGIVMGIVQLVLTVVVIVVVVIVAIVTSDSGPR